MSFQFHLLNVSIILLNEAHDFAFEIREKGLSWPEI